MSAYVYTKGTGRIQNVIITNNDADERMIGKIHRGREGGNWNQLAGRLDRHDHFYNWPVMADFTPDLQLCLQFDTYGIYSIVEENGKVHTFEYHRLSRERGQINI